MSNDRCHQMLKRLNERRKTELMPDDLTKILEEELAKPADEMDTDLVDELVELMGAEMPPEDAKATIWGKIAEKLSPSKSSTGVTVAKQILSLLSRLWLLQYSLPHLVRPKPSNGPSC